MISKIFVFIFSGSLAYSILVIIFPEIGDSESLFLALVIAFLSFFAYVLSKRSRGKSSSDRAVEGYRRRDKRQKDWGV